MAPRAARLVQAKSRFLGEEGGGLRIYKRSSEKKNVWMYAWLDDSRVENHRRLTEGESGIARNKLFIEAAVKTGSE